MYMYMNNDPDTYSAPQYGMSAECGGQNYLSSCPYLNSSNSSDSDSDSDDMAIEYIIQPGDTLWDLANQYNSSVDDIIAANPGLDPDYLQVGQMILIPDPPYGVLNVGWHRPWHRPWVRPWIGPWHRPWSPWSGHWGHWM